ncbi:MAG TPA: hypothetical protein VGC96_13500 [Candidatus Elarobacter sp.]|jgi:hypothetical protein
MLNEPAGSVPSPQRPYRPLSKQARLVLGLATFWPVLYLVIFLGFVLTMVLAVPLSSGRGSPELGVSFFALFAVHIVTIVWIMGLTVFYMIDVFRNPRVVGDRKVLWAVVIFMGGFLAMPVYWYLFMWREPAGAQGASGR